MDKNILIKYLNVMIIAFVFCNAVNAIDSNGVWHNAEDITPGIFGNDENTAGFIFNNSLVINSRLNVTGIVDVVGDLFVSNDIRSSSFFVDNVFSNTDSKIIFNSRLDLKLGADVVGGLIIDSLVSDTINSNTIVSDDITSDNILVNTIFAKVGSNFIIDSDVDFTRDIDVLGLINTDTLSSNTIVSDDITSDNIFVNTISGRIGSNFIINSDVDFTRGIDVSGVINTDTLNSNSIDTGSIRTNIIRPKTGSNVVIQLGN